VEPKAHLRCCCCTTGTATRCINRPQGRADVLFQDATSQTTTARLRQWTALRDGDASCCALDTLARVHWMPSKASSDAPSSPSWMLSPMPQLEGHKHHQPVPLLTYLSPTSNCYPGSEDAHRFRYHRAGLEGAASATLQSTAATIARIVRRHRLPNQCHQGNKGLCSLKLTCGPH
jgi:hypothetical protein